MNILGEIVRAGGTVIKYYALIVGFGLFAIAGVAQGQGSPKAFRTAEGFGADAKGGRGGIVMQVTTLADSGPGSLRECVSAEEPRTCVFRSGGTIVLKEPLSLGGGFLTIAGQTAPGQGILIRAADEMAAGALLRINRDDVVVRHIRFRRGASASSDADRNDSLQLLNANNVILDHISTSWAVDENLGMANSSNVTVQWSIIAEGLFNSNHPKGPHSMGVLMTSEAGNYTMHHNIFAHNQERNPRIKVHGTADIVNNLIYNSGTGPVVVTNDFGDVLLNFVGNTYLKGPNSHGGGYVIRALPKSDAAIGVFAERNDIPEESAALRDVEYSASTAFAAPQVSTQSAAEAYSNVLASAGAVPRDAVDTRIVNEIEVRSGRIIDSPNDVGGWPVIQGGTPYVDADKDGMFDGWELVIGLNPSDPNDRNGDLDGDGYTNLEEFLDDLAEDPNVVGDVYAPG